MRTDIKSPLLILSLIIVLPFISVGQYTVTRVQNQNVSTEGDGFYYSLPRTLFEINLSFEKLEQIRGPLANYTENYLGTSNYITSDGVSYKLLYVDVKPVFEADPEQIYYVQFPVDKSKDKENITFSLTSLGTLLAYDDSPAFVEKSSSVVDQTFIMLEGDDGFGYHPDYHRKKKIDTITKRITIDTVSIERFLFKTSWVDKSMEDKANEAALQIANIREARFNLLSGYQEVNYGESMKYMDYQLKKMERQHLELFLGKEVKSQQYQTVYYLPVKGNGGASIVSLPGGGGEVRITIKPGGNVDLLPETASAKPDNIYYRIPDLATVEISFGGSVIYRKTMPINQLGVVAAAPLGKARTQFDPETGTLTKIIKD